MKRIFFSLALILFSSLILLAQSRNTTLFTMFTIKGVVVQDQEVLQCVTFWEIHSEYTGPITLEGVAQFPKSGL